MGKIKTMRCIACQHLNQAQKSPTDAHHIRYDPATGRHLGLKEKAPDLHTIPLCGEHHKDGPTGIAYHSGPVTWQRIYGREVDLLAETLERVQDGMCA